MTQHKSLMMVIGLAVIAAVAAVVVALAGDNDQASETDSRRSTPAAEEHTSMPGNSTPPAASSGSDTGEAVAAKTVDIKDYAYAPATITIKIGDTVTWTNQDGVGHDVVADNPSDDAPNSALLDKGETYSFKFTKAGTYTYHCSPHPYMKGTVIVTE